LAHFLTRAGEKVVFSDRLRITHRVDRNRFSARYLARLGMANGLGHPELIAKVRAMKPTLRDAPIGPWQVLRAVAALPLRMLALVAQPNAASIAALSSQLGYAYAGAVHIAGSR
jgi:hypothetical protein